MFSIIIMRARPNFRLASCKQFRLISTITSKKSYYEILGVDRRADSKEIRRVFLIKARETHPDHNPSSEAQEQFKLLKEAYETLRDSHRRYLYDTGISDQVDERVYSDRTASGRKYYENKWYGFRPNSYPDQRDEYYERNSEVETSWRYRYVLTGVAVGMGYFAYDYLKQRTSQEDAEREHAKSLLEGSAQDKKARRLNRYITQRARQNKVE